MSRPNFTVKVPLIPQRPQPSHRKSQLKVFKLAGNRLELDTIMETVVLKNNDSTGSSSLKVLETYDEFLNLCQRENNTFKTTIDFKRQPSSVFLLKKVCESANSMLLNECPKVSDIKTAVIAQRIIETEKQLAESRKGSKIGFGRPSIVTLDKLPYSSSITSQTLSNLTSRFLMRPKCERQVQTNLPRLVKQHSCNSQTEPQRPDIQSQYIQTLSSFLDHKFTNTDLSSYPNHEQATQMYEHITKNELLCLEWINRNLFRVPVNPHAVIVDEKLRESSEVTCCGTTNMFDQEVKWEIQALCT